ncbi:MAG: hypothetical protein FVQ77_11215 [Cytophagales bacterium]|nr:hypothetical protein [Cytophagales bacterium]
MILNKKLFILEIIILFQLTFVLSICTNNNGNEQTSTINDTTALTKHWEKAIPNQLIPKGLASLKARDCGQCHQEIYSEWKQSTHALAFQDLQFQAEWKKDGKIFVCINCHTPLQNQQEFIVTGLINADYRQPVKKNNPYFDKSLQQESIGCATCHIRNGNVIGTIGNTNAPHKTIADKKFLSEKLCMSCHNVVDELNPVLVCTFETGDEWKNNWASKAGKTCITCHMPATIREIARLPAEAAVYGGQANGFDERRSHFHNFPGSGIPKFKGMKVSGLNGLEIKCQVETPDNTEGTIRKIIKYKLILKNSFAGHSVPTGDPERFFIVSFKIQDTDGNILKEKQYRIGEEWQWYPKAKKISDNNLKPLEEREFRFEYQIPPSRPLPPWGKGTGQSLSPTGGKWDAKAPPSGGEGGAGSLFLNVTVSKHRMSKKNAEIANLLEDYPLSIIIFEKQFLITQGNLP